MDEVQYRDTYHSVNERRCHFEKTINARVCACRHMRRFNLADREGVGCENPEAHRVCADWLHAVRRASCFALSQPNPVDILPHRLEAKVQAGSLLGLAELMDGSADIDDIASLLARAIDRYRNISDIPMPDIVTAVAEYEPRQRKKTTGARSSSDQDTRASPRERNSEITNTPEADQGGAEGKRS